MNFLKKIKKTQKWSRKLSKRPPKQQKRPSKPPERYKATKKRPDQTKPLTIAIDWSFPPSGWCGIGGKRYFLLFLGPIWKFPAQFRCFFAWFVEFSFFSSKRHLERLFESPCRKGADWGKNWRLFFDCIKREKGWFWPLFSDLSVFRHYKSTTCTSKDWNVSPSALPLHARSPASSSDPKSSKHNTWRSK